MPICPNCGQEGGAEAVRAASSPAAGNSRRRPCSPRKRRRRSAGARFSASRSAELIADVHELAGRANEARRFRELALERYEHKENVVLAARVREVLARG